MGLFETLMLFYCLNLLFLCLCYVLNLFVHEQSNECDSGTAKGRLKPFFRLLVISVLCLSALYTDIQSSCKVPRTFYFFTFSYVFGLMVK